MWSDLKGFFQKFFKKNVEPLSTNLPPPPTEDFFETPIEDIMTQRGDIAFVYKADSFQKVVEMFLKTGFRSLPVCDEVLDNISGIITAHSILSIRESGMDQTNWCYHISHADFVPGSMTVREALQYFYKGYKSSLLFIVDEHGGIQGLLSSFNILKELSAYYFSDYFEEEDMIISREPLIISGRMDLEMFEEEFNANELFTPDDGNKVNTIGGWLCSYIGRVPIKSEKIHHPSGFIFEISQADPRKIHQITLLQVPGLNEEL
jgi:CBS domain containing-hemolysin-like protein